MVFQVSKITGSHLNLAQHLSSKTPDCLTFSQDIESDLLWESPVQEWDDIFFFFACLPTL